MRNEMPSTSLYAYQKNFFVLNHVLESYMSYLNQYRIIWFHVGFLGALARVSGFKTLERINCPMLCPIYLSLPLLVKWPQVSVPIGFLVTLDCSPTSVSIIYLKY